jgi:hypothetical protein
MPSSQKPDAVNGRRRVACGVLYQRRREAMKTKTNIKAGRHRPKPYKGLQSSMREVKSSGQLTFERASNVARFLRRFR